MKKLKRCLREVVTRARASRGVLRAGRSEGGCAVAALAGAAAVAAAAAEVAASGNRSLDRLVVNISNGVRLKPIIFALCFAPVWTIAQSYANASFRARELRSCAEMETVRLFLAKAAAVSTSKDTLHSCPLAILAPRNFGHFQRSTKIDLMRPAPDINKRSDK
eukprot:6188050-Pleurochrysis_carterae.AAC.1